MGRRKWAIQFADRRQEGRRLTESRRAILRGNYGQGWLCFENNTEKRRLSPVPGDWTPCSDELLDAYARTAEPVAGGPRQFTFSGEGPPAEAG